MLALPLTWTFLQNSLSSLYLIGICETDIIVIFAYKDFFVKTKLALCMKCLECAPQL